MAGIDRAILGHKQHLFEETQQDDCQHPELEPDQILVGAGHHHNPGESIDGVNRCHHSIELPGKKKEILCILQRINVTGLGINFRHNNIIALYYCNGGRGSILTDTEIKRNQGGTKTSQPPEMNRAKHTFMVYMFAISRSL